MGVSLDEGRIRLPAVLRRLGAIVLVAGLGCATAEAPAAGTLGIVEGDSLADGAAARPMPAWTAFCRTDPASCRVDPSQPRLVALTDRVLETIRAVNTAVNARIVAVTDQDHWGVSDRWDYPRDGRGDCEDIQIEKRRELAASGLPERAMRMAMVINPEGEGHAVLLVRTDAGDLVLDNRVDAVLPWYRTGYTWVKREGDGGRDWVSLGGVRGPVETAASP